MLMLTSKAVIAAARRRGGGGGGSPESGTFRIQAGSVTEQLTNFPVRVDLARMPATFWASTNAGEDLRWFLGATELPTDLVYCDTLNEKGEIWFKVPSILPFAHTDLTWTTDGVSSRPAAGDTYGMNAVWSDYRFVGIPYANFNDRSGNATDVSETGTVTYSEPVSGTNPQMAGGGQADISGFRSTKNFTDCAGVFTFGCSFLTDDSNQVTPMCMTGAAGGTTSRVNLVVDNGNQMGGWDNSNAWMYSNKDPSTTEWTRSNLKYNGTTQRKLISDLTFVGLDNTITAKTALPYLFIGGSTTAEDVNGKIGWTYVRAEYLSDAWIIAEQMMMRSNTFCDDIANISDGTEGPVLLANRSSTVAVSQGNDLPLNAEAYDTESVYALSATGLIVPKTGLYRMGFAAGVNGSGPLYITQNKQPIEGGAAAAADSGTYLYSGHSGPILMAETAIASFTCPIDGGTFGNYTPAQTSGWLERLPADLKYARAKLTANQNLTTTAAALIWDEAQIDTDSFWSGVNPTRLTVPSGMTRVRVTANFHTANTYNTAFMEIRKNGVYVAGLGKASSNRSGDKYINCASAPIEVPAGDYFEVWVRCANSTHVLYADVNTWFTIEEVPSSVVYCVASSSTAQSCTSSADNILDLEDDEYDPEGMHATSGPNTDMLIVPSGYTKARFSYGIVTDAASTAWMWTQARMNNVNDVGLPLSSVVNQISNIKWHSAVGGWMDVTAGDEFEVQHRCNTGSFNIVSAWAALECIA